MIHPSFVSTAAPLIQPVPRGLWVIVLGLGCTAEDELEVQALTRVDDVYQPVGFVLLHAVATTA